MGVDLTWADVAAVLRQREDCYDSGVECCHEPRCFGGEELIPDESELPYRRLDDVSRIMERLGMGYGGDFLPRSAFSESELREGSWRWQRVPGKYGIALFKLDSNDNWLVTVPEIEEALAAYDAVPESERAELEKGKKWAAWIDWLRATREHGGFIVE